MGHIVNYVMELGDRMWLLLQLKFDTRILYGAKPFEALGQKTKEVIIGLLA